MTKSDPTTPLSQPSTTIDPAQPTSEIVQSSLKPEPPILPTALLDMVHATSAHTSDSSAQKEFGAAQLKWLFEGLSKAFEKDERAQHYLYEVLPATASAIRAFAATKTKFRGARAREAKVDELRLKMLESKAFPSLAEGERARIAYGLIVKLLAAGTGVVILHYIQEHWVWSLIVSLVILLAVLFGDLLVVWVSIHIQLRLFKGAGTSDKEISGKWDEATLVYKEVLLDLLVTSARAMERHYPEQPPLLGDVGLCKVPAHRLHLFLMTPHPSLGTRTPFDVLSEMVDAHFALDPKVARRYAVLASRNTARYMDGGVSADVTKQPPDVSPGQQLPPATAPKALGVAPTTQNEQGATAVASDTDGSSA